MTDRDKALIDEAVKRIAKQYFPSQWETAKALARVALELERSGWQPPVNPDVLAVREIIGMAQAAIGGVAAAKAYMDGLHDDSPQFQAALAAYRKHKGGAHG